MPLIAAPDARSSLEQAAYSQACTASAAGSKTRLDVINGVELDDVVVLVALVLLKHVGVVDADVLG